MGTPRVTRDVNRRRVPTSRYVIFGLALAGSVLLMFRGRRGRASELTAPPVPLVQVWVTRDGSPHVWAGEPLAPGSTVRFEIGAPQFTRASVLAFGPPHVALEAALEQGRPTRTAPLPLDPSAATTELALVLSNEPLDGASVADWHCAQSVERWCSRFTFHARRSEP